MSDTPVRVGWRADLARTGGFTLVELLIALVLIAVITVLLFGALRLGTRTWEGVDRVTERVADMRSTLNLIESLLRQSREATATVEVVPVRVFAGKADALEWVAPLSEQVGTPGLYLLRLTLEGGGEYPRLVLTRWLLHPDVLAGGEGFPAWEPLKEGEGAAAEVGDLDQDAASGVYGRTLLLPAVERFELSYFGTPSDLGTAAAADEPLTLPQPAAGLPGGDDQGTGEWVEEWLEQPMSPERVRIVLATPTQSWPAAEVVLPGVGGAIGGLGR